MKFLHVIVIALVHSFGCAAQEVIFKNYNEQNGLPSSEVYCVFEDREGFIWLTTDNGVARFDGGEFKLFNKSNGLADAVVFSVMEDSKSNLWFRTFAGVTSSYKNGKMTPYQFNDRIVGFRKDLGSMIVDSLDNVYFANGAKGIFRITSKGVFEFVPTLSAALSIYEITDNNFICSYIGKEGVAVRSASLNGKDYSFEIPKGESAGPQICKRWKGRIYLSMNHRLLRLEGSEAKLVFDAPEPIISLSIDREDNFWIGLLGKGAIRFSEDSFDHPWEMPLLKNRSVTSMLQDKEGGLWFSTLERGVYYLPNPKTLEYHLGEDSKTNFCLADNKSIFIGFYNGALVSIDKQTKRRNWAIDLHRPVVAGVSLQNDSLLWVSTSQNSVLVNNQGKVVKTFPYDPKVGARFISKRFFKTNQRIWGVNSYGVLEFDLKSNQLGEHRLDFWSRNIFIDNNDVYLAGITGLQKTDKSFQKITEIEAFNNDKVSGFALLPDKRILVSTVGNGFKIIGGNKIESYSKKEGIIFENVYSSAVDNFLWLGTEKGLLRVDLKLLLDKGLFAFELLDKNSGLSSGKVNFIIRNGSETWCIHNTGFSVFKDQEVLYANQNPIPHLNGITVNSSEIDLSLLHDLPYDKNNISFSFGFQSYNNRNLFLRHRATSSNPWNYTEDLMIHYYALAPGKYNFEVEFSTDRVHWKKISFPNHVNIRPVWWQTIYFRLIILLVISLIIFVYFRAKYKSKLLKLELAEQLKSEKERIAQDLHDNIGSKLVSLSLGLNHVVKEYEINADTAEMIYSNVNTTVLELRDTIWAIQKEGITISEFCDKIKNLVWRLRQNNGTVQYDLQISAEVDDHILKPTQAINLYRIVQEAIANSQKHSCATLVSVSIFHDVPSDRFDVEVKDNGKGFDLNNSLNLESYGLKNMRSRATELGAFIEIRSQAGSGTQIVTTLQLSD